MLGKTYAKLTKIQLDRWASTFGAIVAVAEFLFAFDVLNKKQAFAVASAASLMWAWLTNQIPAPSLDKINSRLREEMTDSPNNDS